MFSSIRKTLSLVFLFILGCLSVYGAYWLVTPKTVLQKLKHEGFIPLITQTVEDDDKWGKKKLKNESKSVEVFMTSHYGKKNLIKDINWPK